MSSTSIENDVGSQWARRMLERLDATESNAIDGAAACRTAFEAMKAGGVGEAWELDDRPLVLAAGAFDGWFGMDALAAACERGEMAEAGQGLQGAGGAWQMKRVGARDTAVPWELVAECLRSQKTVVFNSADARCPQLAALSLAAIDAFSLPVCVNLYATGASTRVSAPPHTDKQRVFVLQTEGSKHWRVFAPPPPGKRPTADPLARGKGDDSLTLSELDKPLLDVVLTAGEALYVPAGFPHTTATADDAASLHITLGVDTHVWGLDAISACSGALERAGLPNKLRPEIDVDAEVYWRWGRSTLPGIGWSATNAIRPPEEELANFLAQAARAMEPGRWDSDVAAINALDARAVAHRLIDHASALVDDQAALYADTVLAAHEDTFIRQRLPEHFAKLEATMLRHLDWYRTPLVPSSSRLLQPGDKIKVMMLGTNDWFEAIVDAAHTDGTADVVYFDGELERSVPANRIRSPRHNHKLHSTGKKAPSGKSGKSSGGFAAANSKKKAGSKRRR